MDATKVLLLMLAIISMSGCRPNSNPGASSNSRNIDYESLMGRLTNLHKRDLAYFHENWQSVCDDLNQYIDAGQLKQQSEDDRWKMYAALSIMSIVRHPDMDPQHREEIEQIMVRIGAPGNLNAKILKVLQNSNSGSDD